MPKRDELIGKLQNELEDVEFIGFSELSYCFVMSKKDKDEVYGRIKRMKDKIDGIIVFGGYLDKELTSLGLPVIMVRLLFGAGDWEKSIFNYYRNEKLLTVCLSDFDISQNISESRVKELVEKIKLITALKKIKETGLLVIQEPENFGNYDIEGMDYHFSLPEDYNKTYLKNLKDLGLKVTHANLIELNEEIERVDGNEAKKMTDLWINEAKEIRETNSEEVLKAAKMYLGMEQLMKKYDADGVAIRSLVPWTKGLINITPCMANTELNKHNRVAVCEGLVNSAITEMFSIHAFDRPGFIGDVVGIDTINDAVTFAHCQCPINPHGTDRVPYIIRSHTLQKHNKMIPDDYPESGSNLGVAVQVELPTDEPVTSIKFNIYNKKIAVSKGVSISGKDLYKNFEDILCRTKLVMKTNSKAFEKNYDDANFGVHRNLIFGDFKEKIKDIATLIGFDIVEEDL